jgi:hypothetical protein
VKTNLTDIFVVAYLMMNIFACGTSSESESETSWTLEVVDSIQVAHLGEMMLLGIFGQGRLSVFQQSPQ